MKAVVYIAVSSFIVYTVKSVAPKQLNLALETVLKFDKTDQSADLGVIEKAQEFLEQIKNGMISSARRSNTNDMTFTQFIVEAAKILKSLDDDNLEDAYVIMNEESRRYINRENELRELFGNTSMRRFVSDKLDSVKDMPAEDLRRHLNSVISVIQFKKHTGETKNILDIGNTLYDGAGAKLNKALKKLNKLRRDSAFNLENVVKNTLNSLIFHHYVNLGDALKGKVINMAKQYWRGFTDKRGDGKAAKYSKIARAVTPLRQRKIKRVHKTKETKKVKDDTKETSEKQKVFLTDTDTEETSEKQEVFFTDTEVKKLIEVSTSHPVHNNNSKRKPEGKNTIKTIQKNGGTNKKNIRTEYEYSQSTESDESLVVMGGQTVREINFRGKELSSEDDRLEEGTSTEEIIIQHSNIIDVGLSRKSPGRINITFVSAENHKKDRATTSASDKFNVETRVIRKSNVNDTLGVKSNAEDTGADVDKMIKNIEKQIEEVKDQVEYVKSLTQIKRSDNSNVMSSNNTENDTGEVADQNTGFSFRAQYDPDTISTETNQNDSNKTTLNKSTNTTAGTEKTNMHRRENTSINAKNDTLHLSIGKELKDISDAHDLGTPENEPDTGMSISEKDLTHKTKDHDNATAVNTNSSATNLVDINSLEHV